jgi:hypothetical protein
MKKYLFYAVVLMVMTAGCRPAKKVQRIEQSISKKDTAVTVIVTPAIDSFSIVRNIVDSINKRRIDFTTFSAKIKVDYEGKEGSDQATAYVRIQKDSIIWLSLTGALGIEGYRLIISKDSFRLMNKLKKKIQYRSIAYLQEITEVPFDFHSLQDVIIGNPVFIDSNIVSYRNTENGLLVLMIGNVFKNLLTIENDDYRIMHSKLDDVNTLRNRTCDITYDAYEKKDDFYFSTKRRISVAEKSKLDINIEFKQYNFNKPQDYPFNIPKNYKRA